MKTEVKRNLDKTYLLIEEAGIYEEDYQMHMLRENKIPGLLEVRGRGAGENSQYYYDISCKVSMKTKYEKILERADGTAEITAEGVYYRGGNIG